MYVQGVAYNPCDPDVKSEENKTDSEDTTFVLVIFWKVQFWISQKHMYATDFVEH